MMVTRQNYGFSVTLQRGTDFMTNADIHAFLQRNRIKMTVADDDYSWHRITIYVRPDRTVSSKSRESFRVAVAAA